MFQYFVISFTMAPILVGVLAANGRKGTGNPVALRVGWVVYAVLWFACLYYLRHRWAD